MNNAINASKLATAAAGNTNMNCVLENAITYWYGEADKAAQEALSAARRGDKECGAEWAAEMRRCRAMAEAAEKQRMGRW